MQQQPGKMQDCAICHFVALVVPCFLGFQYWFPVSRCNSQYLHHTVASVAQHSQFNSLWTTFFLFSYWLRQELNWECCATEATAWWRYCELHLETGNHYWKPRKHGTASVTKWRIAQSCIFPGCCCMKCRPIQDEVWGKSYFLYLLKILGSVQVPLSILRPIWVSPSWSKWSDPGLAVRSNFCPCLPKSVCLLKIIT